MKKLGVAALALVVAGGVGLWSFGGTGGSGAQTALPVMAAMAQDTATTAELPDVPAMVIGNPDAKVQIIEYASYTCPHCASFHEASFKPLKAEYIDTGKIKFELREVYFDRYGLWASIIARCGGDMRYFGISGMLFEQQREWAASDDAQAVVGNLLKIGRTAGMDDASMNVCLNNGPMAQAMVTKFQTQAAADQLEGTPTIIINGTKYGNMPYAELKALIDAELAK